MENKNNKKCLVMYCLDLKDNTLETLAVFDKVYDGCLLNFIDSVHGILKETLLFDLEDKTESIQCEMVASLLSRNRVAEYKGNEFFIEEHKMITNIY